MSDKSAKLWNDPLNQLTELPYFNLYYKQLLSHIFTKFPT